MTNLHYIADEQLGGVEREFAEVDRKANVGDLVIYDGKVREVTYVGLTAMSLDARIHVDISAMLTLDPTGNVRIDGTVYRMVDRKAAVGEKVLITKIGTHEFDVGDVTTIILAEDKPTSAYSQICQGIAENFGWLHEEEYVVLEPINDSADLTLTEADVRNNPRQVIDLIANLADRLSKLEVKVALTDDRVSRLGTANQKAYDIVSRNVETWAQEFEEYKQSPAPWATQEQLVELTKQVAEIAGRKQPKDSAVEISELTAKSALLIAEAKVILELMALTAEERREL